jgi:hypothetical protein
MMLHILVLTLTTINEASAWGLTGKEAEIEGTASNGVSHPKEYTLFIASSDGVSRHSEMAEGG